MVPAFRIVAYYRKGTETVSASLWVDVTDQCKQVGIVIVFGPVVLFCASVIVLWIG